MTGKADRFAQAAEMLVGTDFRLHGANPATGLDCIGLVVAALRGADLQAPVRLPPYRLRQSRIDGFESAALWAGFVPIANGETRRGDLCLVRPGPAQWHLLIAARADAFIHAHAGLRRVVVQPAPLPWPIAQRWRFAKPKERAPWQH